MKNRRMHTEPESAPDDQLLDKLIVSAIQVDGAWVVISRYGDDCWTFTDIPDNRTEGMRWIEFTRVPVQFKDVTRAVVYRYMQRGREGKKKPKGPTIINFFESLLPFLNYLGSLKISNLAAVTPLVCSNYVKACREYRKKTKSGYGHLLAQGTLAGRFQAVEALYELSQYASDKMSCHPWIETSAYGLAGVVNDNALHRQECKTPLIPDDVFCRIFERAYDQVKKGSDLLDVRDFLDTIKSNNKYLSQVMVLQCQNSYLREVGWSNGLSEFNGALLDLRTACYIVLASVSGCRNHELTNLQNRAHRRTEDDEGTIYHWFHSRSSKTDAGFQDWMIPEVGVRALRVIERWAAPYQARIAHEIAARRKANPLDPEIWRAKKSASSVFLGMHAQKGNRVRTLSLKTWNVILRTFATKAGVDWHLTSHQFRRKFANYAAHSKFGDLRYLCKHFVHWTMDMTLGYTRDRRWDYCPDLELYMEVQSELEDIKLNTVANWLGEEKLAGGYGQAVRNWRRDSANLAIFKDRRTMVASIAESTAIRSNGHAWCTADSLSCSGNTLERTRCTGCSQSVIGREHIMVYRHLYDHLTELLGCKDIGEGGRLRVQRDLDRCREVFSLLGYDIESATA